jgi:hypothetical protein
MIIAPTPCPSPESGGGEKYRNLVFAAAFAAANTKFRISLVECLPQETETMAKAKKSKSKDQTVAQTTGQTTDQTMDGKNPHPWLGKTILAGLTWRDTHGHATDQKQIYGVITRINEDEHFMEVDHASGEYWALPYYPETIMQQPPRGKYVCRSSRQVVVNPDFLMSWRILQTEGGEQRGWQPNYLLFSEPVEPREWEFTPDRDMEFLQSDIFQRGGQYIGKHLLIGIQHIEVGQEAHDGKLIQQEQRHGEIVRANPADGIIIKQANGEEYKMPPDLTLLEPAPNGEYRLRSTGEVVVNPDYIANWAIYHDPKKHDE